jgi:recombination protein RecR
MNQIEQLIYIFSKLPSLGPRSARRIVLHLLQDKEIRLNSLIQSLNAVSESIYECIYCGNIDTSEHCDICIDKKRDTSVIAIVETVAELWAIERSGIFFGRYHVLGKNSSNIASKYDPSELKLHKLLDRIIQNQVQELIIATNSTIDGQTCSYLITEYFKEYNIKISKLASGIPIGGEIDYLDEGTLSAALNSRIIF